MAISYEEEKKMREDIKTLVASLSFISEAIKPQYPTMAEGVKALYETHKHYIK